MCEYRSKIQPTAKASERALEWHQIMSRWISNEIELDQGNTAFIPHYLRKTVSAYCKEQRKHPALRKKSKSVVFLRKEDSSLERGISPN